MEMLSRADAPAREDVPEEKMVPVPPELLEERTEP